MITTCTGCRTRYRLDDRKVPNRLVRVRCPRCRAVFLLDGTRAGRPEEPEPLALEREGDSLVSPPDGEGWLGGGAEAAGAGSAAARVAPAAEPETSFAEPSVGAAEAETGFGGMAAEADPFAAAPEPATDDASGFGPGLEMGFEPAARSTAPAPAARGGAAVAQQEAPAPAAGRRSRDKAAMLARALVSDILVYNREKRDRALQEGTLLEELGPDIKKSWELYKERVTPEVANGTTHFRDALNEILADGQKVF